jgi:glutamyl-tRNA(Gln) amidotransferase subunit D
MMWVLGNEKDKSKAAALVQGDLKGECNRRSAHGL